MFPEGCTTMFATYQPSSDSCPPRLLGFGDCNVGWPSVVPCLFPIFAALVPTMHAMVSPGHVAGVPCCILGAWSRPWVFSTRMHRRLLGVQRSWPGNLTMCQRQWRPLHCGFLPPPIRHHGWKIGSRVGSRGFVHLRVCSFGHACLRVLFWQRNVGTRGRNLHAWVHAIVALHPWVLEVAAGMGLWLSCCFHNLAVHASVICQDFAITKVAFHVTNGCYQLCRGCCAWSVFVWPIQPWSETWQLNGVPIRSYQARNLTVGYSRDFFQTLPEEERKKCTAQSASSKIRQNSITGSISIRKVAGTILVSPHGVVAMTWVVACMSPSWWIGVPLMAHNSLVLVGSTAACGNTPTLLAGGDLPKMYFILG